MEKILVNSGKKRYQIVDEYDNELGIIIIDPKDVNLAKRALVAKDNILAYIDRAASIADSEKKKDAIEEISDIDEMIKKELNTMLGYDISSSVFKETNCLSTSNGITFVERFLDAIIPVIEKEFEKEFKAAESRINKYTAGYHE